MASNSEVLSKKLDRVKKSVEQFPAVSSSLNSATDQLGKSVGHLDAVLKAFSLGIPTWVSFHSCDESRFPHFYSEELGYSKIAGRWGVAVRTVTSDDPTGENEKIEQWLFCDAPRLLRVRAIEVIPELLEALLARASEMTKEMTEKAEEVDALTAGISSVIHPPTSQGLINNFLRHDQNIVPAGALARAAQAQAKTRK